MSKEKLQQEIIDAQDAALYNTVAHLSQLLDKRYLTNEGIEVVRNLWVGIQAALSHVEEVQKEIEAEEQGERRVKVERFINDFTDTTQDLIPQYEILA